jgi:tRNA threonylcarbamoyladenosine biosynthesis protein TsaE
LGIDPRLVHSPTFTLVSEYRGRRVLAHVDLYRVERIGEIEELGLDDLRERNLIVAVEWAERLPPGLAPGAVSVRIEIAAGEERRITIARG